MAARDDGSVDRRLRSGLLSGPHGLAGRLALVADPREDGRVGERMAQDLSRTCAMESDCTRVLKELQEEKEISANLRSMVVAWERDLIRMGDELEQARCDLDVARAWSARWKLAARDHWLRSRHWVSEYWRLLDGRA